jgi:hypothetical protein
VSDVSDVGFALNVNGGDVQDLDYIEVRTMEQRDVGVAKTHKEDEQGVLQSTSGCIGREVGTSQVLQP